MRNGTLPETLEELMGFKPPDNVPLPDYVTMPFINAVRGKTFGGDVAALVSRYGDTDYDDHPLQNLKILADRKILHSYFPGPDGSDASVAVPFLSKKVDADYNYVLELQYGCKTTFILKRTAITATLKPYTQFSPMMITSQRDECLQRIKNTDIQIKRCS